MVGGTVFCRCVQSAISLVKSDWKLRQKTLPLPTPFPASPAPFLLVRHGRLEKLISAACRDPPLDLNYKKCYYFND